MSSNRYEEFKEAERRLSDGWIQGRMDDGCGSVCLMGAVGGSDASEDVILKINAELERYVGYRVLRFFSRFYHWDHPVAIRYSLVIQGWNDLHWRKKETVVKTLGHLADSEKPEWLENEVLRLSIEMSVLREQISELKVRLALAEAENRRFWRRILGTTQQANQDQLEELEAELCEKSERMEFLQPTK